MGVPLRSFNRAMLTGLDRVEHPGMRRLRQSRVVPISLHAARCLHAFDEPKVRRFQFTASSLFAC